MLSMLQKLIGVAGLILIMFLFIMFFWSSLFSWNEAELLLESKYPKQSYFRVGGSTKWSLNGEIKKSTYLILPENKTVYLVKKNDTDIKMRE